MNYTDEEMQIWSEKAKKIIVDQMVDLLQKAESTGDKMNVVKVTAACTSALLSSLFHIMALTMPPDALPIAAMSIGGQFVAMANDVKNELKKMAEEDEKI